jgi:3-oxoacyl-[acyl-carrier-protein] synthase-3
MTFSRIAGTGSYLPAESMSNDALAKAKGLDTSDAWIQERTGIAARHIASVSEDVVSMGTAAATVALSAAGVSENEVDLIIVATCSYETTFPSAACAIQQALGISTQCPAFDIQAACTGFIYALSVADQFIRAGTMKTILVIGSETMTRVLDWQDRATCVLFGDGAGAVVLRADEKAGILSTELHANGAQDDILTLEKSAFLTMQGSKVFRFGVTHLDLALKACLKTNGLTIDQLDWFIPHQANIRMIQAMAEKLGFPMEKVVATLHNQGNTSAASIPLALDHAMRMGHIQVGHRVLLEAIGGGVTWGTALIQF